MFTKRMNLSDILTNHIPVHGNANHHPDSFGIEVELEGRNIVNCPMSVQASWTQHNDGSLRKLGMHDECIEYISRAPLPFDELCITLNHLFTFLSTPPRVVYDSYRTSIHVHVNFAKESFRTIYCFMTLSLLFDELLTSQNGEHRIGNNFCLRAKDAMGQLVSLIQSIDHGNNFFEINQNDRYSSINFASLNKFGSIEFRSLECTTDKGRLLHWINTLQRLKDMAKTFRDPTEIIGRFSRSGPKIFLMDMLGPYADKYLLVPYKLEMLQNGMRIAQDLAFCSSWSETGQIEQPRPMKIKVKLPPGLVQMHPELQMPEPPMPINDDDFLQEYVNHDD